jgi:hypothetical protein
MPKAVGQSHDDSLKLRSLSRSSSQVSVLVMCSGNDFGGKFLNLF